MRFAIEYVTTPGPAITGKMLPASEACGPGADVLGCGASGAGALGSDVGAGALGSAGADEEEGAGAPVGAGLRLVVRGIGKGQAPREQPTKAKRAQPVTNMPSWSRE